jgi:hypothetical protein
MYTLKGLVAKACLVLALCPALAAAQTNQALLLRRSHSAETAMKAGVVTVVQTVVCMQVPTDPPTTTDPPVVVTTLAAGCDTSVPGQCVAVPVPTSLAAGCNTSVLGQCARTQVPGGCSTATNSGCLHTEQPASCTGVTTAILGTCPITAYAGGCNTFSHGCPSTSFPAGCDNDVVTQVAAGCAATVYPQICYTQVPACGGATSAWHCNVTTVPADCASVVASGCGTTPQTSTDACAKNTFPVRCQTQAANMHTCSDSNCNPLTYPDACTSVLCNIRHLTAEDGCYGWTIVKAGSMCSTQSCYCYMATLSGAGNCTGTSAPTCNEGNTNVIACVNTSSGGVYCSSAGACNTWGPQCITTTSGNIGMCGEFSAASGVPCPSPDVPVEPTALNLVGGFAALLACFAFKKVA